MENYSDVAVTIPCFNEAVGIREVIQSFTRCLPGAAIHVFDNCSTDTTAEVSRECGASVHSVSYRGKGNVVRRIFSDVTAPIMLIIDGDGTYPADAAPALIAAIRDGADMAVGVRKESHVACYRKGHRFGNRFLSLLVERMFSRKVGDMLSGYRAFSHRFVKSFPASSKGFEIETELTIHALEQRIETTEIAVTYLPRSAGSSSKLRTYRDGARILLAIVYLFKEVRPLLFFSSVSFLSCFVALVLGVPVVLEFVRTGLVPRFPTAILASALVVIAMVAFAAGVILDGVARLRRQFAYSEFVRHSK